MSDKPKKPRTKWRIILPSVGVYEELAYTKSEARGQLKRKLQCPRIPVGAVITPMGKEEI